MEIIDNLRAPLRGANADTILLWARAVRTCYEELGISLNQSCRLEHSLKLVEVAIALAINVDATIGVDVGTVRAVSEVVHVARICHRLRGQVVDARFRSLLHELLDDSVEENERGPTPGRDKQFELFLAATCLRAGCVVRSLEPDLVVMPRMGGIFALAAKRLKTGKKIARRTREASKQLATNKTEGFVVLDISRVLEKPPGITAEDGSILIPPGYDPYAIVEQLVDGFSLRHFDARDLTVSYTVGVLYYANVALKILPSANESYARPAFIDRWFCRAARPADAPHCTEFTLQLNRPGSFV